MNELGAAFRAARSRLGRSPTLDRARAELDSYADASSAPMRVALVGRVSAGKSTLANALLGGYRAPTGATELTYTVTWISHGDEPGLTIHFLDGRAPQHRGLDELERLVVRAEHDPGWAAYLATIEHLRVTDPAPYLRAFDLVDTPGLDSVHGDDSDNTLRFLDGPVDALVLVLARSMTDRESSLLAGFHGRSLIPTPINAVAALTKVEHLWPAVADPLADGRAVADDIMAQQGLPVVHRVCPVASLVAAGAAELGAADLADLQVLAALPGDTLAARLRRIDAFGAREYTDIAVPAARRAALVGRLSRYGIVLATTILREGVADVAGLRAELDERSGMAQLRSLLAEHFGNRAELLTLNRTFGRVQSLPDRLGADLEPRDRAALADAVREFSRHAMAQHARFRELEVLRAFYENRLLFAPDEGAELLRATGEHGQDPCTRLGLPAGTGHAELVTAARHRLGYWRTRDAVGGPAGASRLAVTVLVRTYERLLGQLSDRSRQVAG